MRAVIQRVSRASVEVSGEVVGEIARGLCVLVGVARGDDESDAAWLAKRVVAARIFTDDADKMNLSVKDVEGSVLAVSQFTLLGDIRRGTRPSFSAAESPERARDLFDRFCNACQELGVPVQTGTFRAHMEVGLNNTGPVTILVDSKKLF